MHPYCIKMPQIRQALLLYIACCMVEVLCALKSSQPLVLTIDILLYAWVQHHVRLVGTVMCHRAFIPDDLHIALNPNLLQRLDPLTLALYL